MNDSEPGRVAVIIPARDEEANIERVVRSVAGQRHVAEIVAVDDESRDRTGEILERLKAEIPVMRVLRAGPLPEGWTGKSHAVATGAAAASAEWLLLTDADTVHLSESLEILLARATSERIDLLSVSPGQETPTWWEKAVIPLVYVELARKFRFEDVSNPASPVAAANGQYILVRREVYERVGGHAAVRGEILEDVALARRVKSAGGKLLFLPGAHLVRTRMYRTFGEMWRGWTKNLFLLYDRDLGQTGLRIAELVLLNVLPIAVFLALVFVLAADGDALRAVRLTVTSILLILASHARYARALTKIGYAEGLAVYLVPGAALVVLLLLNSARAHVFGGEVDWKGRAYSTRDFQ